MSMKVKEQADASLQAELKNSDARIAKTAAFLNPSGETIAKAVAAIRESDIAAEKSVETKQP